METTITIVPTFDDALNCNILVRKTINIEDEQITKNWRCVLAKGADLKGLVFDTTFGRVVLDGFPAEKQFIVAKWAE